MLKAAFCFVIDRKETLLLKESDINEPEMYFWKKSTEAKKTTRYMLKPGQVAMCME